MPGGTERRRAKLGDGKSNERYAGQSAPGLRAYVDEPGKPEGTPGVIGPPSMWTVLGTGTRRYGYLIIHRPYSFTIKILTQS